MGLASYRRLCHVQDNRHSAHETRAEQQERREFRNAMREKMRQRGQSLKADRKQLQQRIGTTMHSLDAQAHENGALTRAERDRGKERIDEAQREWVEHGQQLRDEFAQFEVRKRAAIEARRLQKERETISMRADLKSQKQTVDATNLANARALVARVRADTAHDKIRLAKTAFVDQRWDKADALRDEISAWKARRRDQELHYLAGAVQTNQEHRTQETIEQVRDGMRGEKAEMGAATRHARDEMRKLSKEQRREHKETARENYLNKQGAKVELLDMPPSPTETTVGSMNPVELFARVFGFGRSAATPRSARSATQSNAMATPRSPLPSSRVSARGFGSARGEKSEAWM